MNQDTHDLITMAAARIVFWDWPNVEEIAKELGYWAKFPDNVQDIEVEGVGFSILNRGFQSLDHFLCRHGKTWRGYCWSRDPSVRQYNLPNRKVIVHPEQWIEHGKLTKPHPMALIVDTPGYLNAADEMTFASAAAMDDWMASEGQGPTDGWLCRGGGACHYNQDSWVWHHSNKGRLLYGHSEKEKEYGQWAKRNLDAMAKKYRSVGKGLAIGLTPRAQAEYAASVAGIRRVPLPPSEAINGALVSTIHTLRWFRG